MDSFFQQSHEAYFNQYENMMHSAISQLDQIVSNQREK